MAAARAEQSVHYVSSGNYGPAEITFVGDAGVSQGIQRITFREGAQTGHVTVLVSANTAYVRGDAFTLVNYMRFMPGAAAKYAGRWILIPHTAAGYPTVAAGVRLSSTMAELKVSGHLSTVASTKIDGQRVFGVRGTRTASGRTTVETLYARAAGSPLPVREIATQGTMRFIVTLDGWNEPIRLATPKGAVPISVVQKTS